MNKLPSGTMFGSEDEIKALGDATGPLYHYTQHHDAVLSGGFLGGRGRSMGDGIYFMNDPEHLKGWTGEGGPIKAYIVGKVAQIGQVVIPVGMEDDIEDEFGTRDVQELCEPGTLGDFLRALGYAGWTDGYQYAALKPNAIAIVAEPSPADVVEQLLDDALQGLRVNVHFQLNDTDEKILPGVVSKEVKPRDREFGEWRLTLFNDEMRPVGHVTFDHKGAMTAKAIEKSITKAGEFGRLVNYFNENPFVGDSPYANTASLSPMTEDCKVNWNRRGIGGVPKQIDLDYFGFTKEMTASEFQRLVPPGVSRLSTATDLRPKAEAGEAIAPPFLIVDWDAENKMWIVLNHEGRSRSRLVCGHDKLPVDIFPRHIRARDLTPEMIAAPFIPQRD